jgi:hypothetical protein
MIAIYVRKDWLAEIGDNATEFLHNDVGNDMVELIASKTELESSFLFCHLLRTKPSETNKGELPAHIPVDVIRGIFDLTENQIKKLGF